MKVSIVITAYNVAKYIEKCIKSAINQSYKDIEIIVVNDCSTDNTENIIKKFPVKLINNEINLGAGMSRRIGIKESTGEYIMLLDSDDWIEDKCIEELVNNSEDCDIVVCGRNIVENDKIIDYTKYENKKYEDVYEKLLKRDIKFLNSVIVRKKLYNIVEYSDARYIEDVQTLYKIAYYANAIKTISYIGYNYFQREGSLCHNASSVKSSIYTCLAIIDMYNFFNNVDKTLIKRLHLKESLMTEIIKFSNDTSDDWKLYKTETNKINNFLINNIWI